MNSKPRIVVLGAGYAGIAAVRRLQTKLNPQEAQMAIQQGGVCADNILAALQGAEMNPCQPHIRGTLVSLGSGKTVGVVGTRTIKGRPAMLLKELVSLKYLIQMAGCVSCSIEPRAEPPTKLPKNPFIRNDASTSTAHRS